MHTIKPLDEEAIISAAKETGGIVTLEEHNRVGGLMGAVAETLLTAGARPGFFRSVALGDVFPTIVGDQSYLRGRYRLDVQAIQEAIAGAIATGTPLTRIAKSA